MYRYTEQNRTVTSDQHAITFTYVRRLIEIRLVQSGVGDP